MHLLPVAFEQRAARRSIARLDPGSVVTDRVSPTPSIDPVSWRADVLDITLRVSFYLGIVVGMPSMYLAAKAGLFGLTAIDGVVLVVVFVIYQLRRIPYIWRAALFCVCAFAIGVALLLAVGTFSQLFLIACSVIATLLLGVRAGLIATAVGTVTIALFGLLGLSGPESPQRVEGMFSLRQIVVALNFMLVSTLLTMAIGRVLATLEGALRAEIATRVSLDRERTLLRALFDNLPDVIFTKDMAGRFTTANPAARAEWSAATESEMLGKTVFDRFPRAQAEALHTDDMAVVEGRALVSREIGSVDHDGNPRWYLQVKVPLRDSTGAITGMIGISRNITERRRLEEQLRQSQKMEAVGRLAGGIAHDFNNLLTIIFGYSDVLRTQTRDSDEIRESVEAINDAASRAAALTRQLLAFSRQSMLQPKVLDLNATIADTGRMLSRLIGEDIQFTLILDPSIAKVRVDPGQLDQVLMNLAVNARDAMPHGGTLSIATQRVELTAAVATRLEGTPGPHVMVVVTDTGVGMSPDVMARIFEPFFTTKGVGNGTGLGLAMVFGIVRQSGGTIDVESEPGQGATFRIYLPTVADGVTRAGDAELVSLRGSETLLLVEDDTGVRDLAVANLRAQGYSVLTAVDGRAAIDVVVAHAGPIHLLVTDVVMPRMSGPELATELQSAAPGLRVLFVSGYTDDDVVRQGVLQSEVAFLQKPYTPHILVAKVRAVLDDGRLGAVLTA